MKKSEKAYKMLFRKGLFCFSFLFLFCAQAIFSAPESFAIDLIGARVLETEGVVESKIPGEKIKLLEPGDFVKSGEELNIHAESWVALVMADSTVRKFNGPATVTIEEDLAKTGEGVLARLGSAIVGMLFSQKQERSEAVMTTRRVESLEGNKNYLPLLVHPAPGSNVLERPTKFEWRGVEGVPLYRVSVYGSDRILWQGTTSDSYINCPAEYCNFDSGEEYYWVVEGLIGNSALRSKASDFKVLPEDTRSELDRALREADLSCPDPKLTNLIKVRLCLNLNLYDKALELFDSYWTEESLDRRAYLLRAEIKEKMGLLEDAFSDYKNASSIPAIK
jgi:hypothetical protein